ncbi:MAG: signal peptidase II [Candidatus Marinimicrobia bacterium]|nr:signal peptidase II [Candidatus Neomarinimicrobiota bacterium]
MKRQSVKILYSIGSGIVLLCIDFLSKFIANARLPFEKVQDTFLPFLVFYRTHNTGYHFLFGPINNHFLWALSGLIFVSALIASLIHSLVKENLDRINFTVYAAILALTIGATGNVLEILFAGHATDFFIFRPFPWPSNFCDQYINGILYITLPVIIIKSLIERIRHKRLIKAERENRDT